MSRQAILTDTEAQARQLAPLLDSDADIKLYSDDDAFANKWHLHDLDTGQILTQINVGASIDFDAIDLIDLR